MTVDNVVEVKKAIKGDKAAFSKIIDHNKEYLYRIAFLHMRNENDALDVVHDTVYKAFISINKLRKPEYFRTWISKILINTALDAIKLKQRQVSLEDIELCEEYMMEYDKSMAMDIAKELEELSEQYKSVIKMRYIDDMKIKDIAQKSNMAEGTVKTNIRRGLKILKSRLGEEY